MVGKDHYYAYMLIKISNEMKSSGFMLAYFDILFFSFKTCSECHENTDNSHTNPVGTALSLFHEIQCYLVGFHGDNYFIQQRFVEAL